MKMRKVIALCCMLVFAMSCKKVNLNPESQTDSGKDSGSRISAIYTMPPIVLATYNIRLDTQEDSPNHTWSSRKSLVASMITTYKFDVFGTQEVEENQLADLVSLLPDYSYFGANRKPDNTGERTAIFYKTSKFQRISSGNFWLSETPSVAGSIGWDAQYPRVCSWVKLKEVSSEDYFYYFNTHVDSGTQAANESVTLLLNKIKEIAGTEPVVLSADFNFDQYSIKYMTMNNSGVVKDAYILASAPYDPKGHTFNKYEINRISDKRIDHIFISPHFQIDQFGILADLPGGKFPSDHYPVRILLKKKPMYPLFPEDIEVGSASMTSPKASYTDLTPFALNAGTYLLDNMVIQKDANDKKAEVWALRFAANNTSPAYFEMLYDLPNGASRVEFKYAAFNYDYGSKFNLEYSTNGGGTWTQTGDTIVVPSSVSTPTPLKIANFYVNLTGNVRFRIVKTSTGPTSASNPNGRLNIDDFAVFKPATTVFNPPPFGGAPVGQTITIKGSNGKFVSGMNGTAPMVCNRSTAASWENFTIVDAGNNQVALKSMSKYVSSENGTAPITCSRESFSTWEKFTWIANEDGTFSLRGNNGRYVSSEDGLASMTCTRVSIGSWEKFTY